jgi:hypothetical protein
VQAALCQLDVEPATRAALPLAIPRGRQQQQVLPASLPHVKPLELIAGDAVVPRHQAPCAEQPLAPLAHGLRDDAPLTAALVVHHHHLGAVRERAVGTPRTEEQGLAECGAPALEHVGGERPTAELRVECRGAGRVGAPHAGAGAAGLDLGADVAGQARAAERVRAGGAAAVGLRGRHGLHADAAVGVALPLRSVGSRHWGTAPK